MGSTQMSWTCRLCSTSLKMSFLKTATGYSKCLICGAKETTLSHHQRASAVILQAFPAGAQRNAASHGGGMPIPSRSPFKASHGGNHGASSESHTPTCAKHCFLGGVVYFYCVAHSVCLLTGNCHVYRCML